jgi:hypothetical protein
LPELKYCANCNFDTTESFTHCPQCGKPLTHSGPIRVRGWILIVVGAFLVLLMGGITVLVTVNLSHFTGNSIQLVSMFLMFGLVIVIGIFSLVTGAWQIKYGKRNKILTFIGFGLAALLVITLMVTLRLFPS